MTELSAVIKSFRAAHQKIRHQYQKVETEQHLREYHSKCKTLAKHYLERWPELSRYPDAIGYPCRTLKDAENFFNGFPYQHGGARSGSGRKKEEATKQIRVPVSLVDSLTALKNMYKGLDAQSKADLIEQINELIASKS
ncbi:hypothetical protein MW334_004441 [Vibrio parahaemolyticus]|nr:hypothetical protein [Vibrio parahaemolyticus]EJB8455096.1 hypothetical protein [Vibrio parahaemolyticus]MBE3902383.1 hypothetical protein [Vibrio parahaemolyticus]